MSSAIGAVAPAQSQQIQDVQPRVDPSVQITPELQPMGPAEGAKAISEEAFRKQMEYLSKMLEAKETGVSLKYDSLSSTKSVTIIDNETGKVIREMPPEAAVAIAERAQAYAIGLLVDKAV
jgi:uncharacterized FlaG/YvyC family protein